ncbi:MAG TPA: ArgE/DapE family deacylase [Jiangellales bacterium]|nr:ArgE/DapE family deacylase [Jiangellales bacterium]
MSTRIAGPEAEVTAAVDSRRVLDDLRELVALPSTGESAAELEVQGWCADRLAGLGAHVDHWPLDLPALRAEPDYPQEEVDRPAAYGCVATWPGHEDGPPALVLAGHTDVVPAGDPTAWRADPYELRVADGVAYGRGACDMKGGLAAVLGAVAAVRTAGVRLRRPLAVHCVVAEEDGGLGAFATLRRGHTGSACVIAEPTAGAVVPANAGSLTFRLEVLGLATHGSTRSRGVSAVDAFVRVLSALRDLESRRNRDVPEVFAGTDLPYPLSVGTVRAGDWASSVPDLLVAEGRYGVRLDEPVAAARAELEAAVAEACAGDPWLSGSPVRVSWPGGVFASGRLPAGDPLLPAVREAVADVTGRRPGVHGAPYGSDLRLYVAAGVPTLQYGPGDVGHAHAVDEHVEVADLERAARVYALLVTRLCGVVR